MSEAGWAKWADIGGLAAAVGVLGLLAWSIFKGDKRMDKLKKIRDAMQFASDAQVPRMQLEATLVLGELANDMLKELRESRDDATALGAEFRRVQGANAEGDAEEHALMVEIRDLLRKLAGVEAPSSAEEPAPEVSP